MRKLLMGVNMMAMLTTPSSAIAQGTQNRLSKKELISICSQFSDSVKQTKARIGYLGLNSLDVNDSYGLKGDIEKLILENRNLLSKAKSVNHGITHSSSKIKIHENEIGRLKFTIEKSSLKVDSLEIAIDEIENLINESTDFGETDDCDCGYDENYEVYAENNYDLTNKLFFSDLSGLDGVYKFLFKGLITNAVLFEDNYYTDSNIAGAMKPINVQELIYAHKISIYHTGDDRSHPHSLISVEEFSDIMPKFELFKSKYVTLSFPNKRTENFVINLGSPSSNNGRRSVEIKMGYERVDSRYKDLVWREFLIGSEVYIAMNSAQLDRLGVSVCCRGTGTQISVARSRDLYMKGPSWVDEWNSLWLFKLEQAEQ
jgi:hypothetical protein